MNAADCIKAALAEVHAGPIEVTLVGIPGRFTGVKIQGAHISQHYVTKAVALQLLHAKGPEALMVCAAHSYMPAACAYITVAEALLHPATECGNP